MNNLLTQNTAHQGQARIICSEDSIGIEVSNFNAKEGRLFARKMADEPNCVKTYSSNDKTVRLEVPFNFLPCGAKSRRMTNPRTGVEYSLTVVLSYGQHLTEDDQMFYLSCRYFSNRREIGTVMEVSTYSKSYLVGGRNGPSCEYSLHYGSLNGPLAENARIGDRVFHVMLFSVKVWKCADTSFALKVYDCFIHDGNNRKYKLVDENGCSKDKTILPELIYDPNLNQAFAASRVFKFAETTRMFFNCLLYMCPKSDAACRRSVPPKCGNNRQKRSISQPTVGPSRLFTVNASLPFDRTSAKSLEQAQELSGEFSQLDREHELLAEQALKPFQVFQDSTTTQLPITTTINVIDSTTPELPKSESTNTVSINDRQKTAAILPAPVIELQPIATTLSNNCSNKNSVKVILVGLVACNVILLSVSTIAIAALCRRHNSAQLDLATRT
ncbi:ZP domain-containing protein [Aphelenchoides bicaudatus]|nr:ZP domain-containing protein [Aphelenchoides bicaudatus]